MRYAYRIVNGSDTAFYRTANAGIIRSMSAPLPDRLLRRIAALGMTPNGASVAAGAHRDLVRNITDGKSQNPTKKNLLGLVRVLSVPLMFFEDDFDDSYLYGSNGEPLDEHGNPVPKQDQERVTQVDDKTKTLIDRASDLLKELPEEDQRHYVERLERDVRLLRGG